MANKPKAKPDSVLGTLPSSRPQRIGAPRGAKPKAAAKTVPRNGTRPTPVRSASPRLANRRPQQPPPRPLGAPKGTELVTTTIRAAGELAQVGLTVGGMMLKRAVDRLPLP